MRALLLSIAAALVAAAPASAAPRGELTAALQVAREDLGARASASARAARAVAVTDAALPASDRRATAAEVRGLAGPARILVGARRPADVPGLAARLRRLGRDVRRLDSVAVVAVTARDPARLAGALAGDARVSYVEPDRIMRDAAEPADDIDPGTGRPFGWAYYVVRAGEALAQVGGGSQRVIAVIDSGFDVGHPDLGGPQVVFNSIDGSNDVSNPDGHGTFVLGNIAMIDGNGIGGKGVAGRTPTVGIKAKRDDDGYPVEAVIRGIEAAVRNRASIINMSFAGTEFNASQSRAIVAAFLAGVLPVAAAGNTGDKGNQVSYPGAQVGGRRGAVGLGLSVGSVRPNGLPSDFSTHNQFVSIAAPGDIANGDCSRGVFSTIPRHPTTMDDPANCALKFGFPGDPSGRWAYGEGTSFSAPIVAGLAALVWQANPRLRSAQVGHVLQRTARQFVPGPRWNEFTGTGAVDGADAVALAGSYDTTNPTFSMSAKRRGDDAVRVSVSGARDRTQPGDELAGQVQYQLATGRAKNGSDLRVIARSSRPISRVVALGKRALHVFGLACDANQNCAIARRGAFKRR